MTKREYIPTYCAICGMIETAVKNNHCLADLWEISPSLFKQCSNTIRAINPVHTFIKRPEPIPDFYGIKE